MKNVFFKKNLGKICLGNSWQFSVSFFLCILATSMLFISCSKLSKVNLVYNDSSSGAEKENELCVVNEPLYALNKTAKNGAITKPSKSSYLYYAFSQEFISRLRETSFSVNPALEIMLSVSDFASVLNDADGQQKVVPAFAFGFLYDDDFSSELKLKKTLAERSLVRGPLTEFAGRSFRVSIAVSDENLKKIRGFAVYATAPVTLTQVRLRNAALGWDLTGVDNGSSGISVNHDNSDDSMKKVPWYGFGSDGGTLIFTEYNRADFTSAEKLFHGNLPPKITVKLTDSGGDIGQYNSQVRVKMNIGSQAITIRRASNQTQASLCASALKNVFENVSITQNAQMVRSLILESVLPVPVFNSQNKSEGSIGADTGSFSEDASSGRVFTPIPCDPALLLSWNKETWRTPDYELFSWEQFPNILLFDIADYDIQNQFFKRLAFFVEKKGYRGRLVSDEEVKNLHGYNAHDYSAESLAAFFEKARVESFQLNEKELLLRDILMANGLIFEENGAYIAGTGAIASMSQESASYLRPTFVAHEFMHGLYFIDADFRSFVSSVFNEMDSQSLSFLTNYFTMTPTLNYDISDTVLYQNEFMGYLMQQSLSNVADYYAKNLATRGSVNKDYPELAKYVRETNGVGFYNSAYKLAHYLFERWGLAAGRTYLVSIE